METVVAVGVKMERVAVAMAHDPMGSVVDQDLDLYRSGSLATHANYPIGQCLPVWRHDHHPSHNLRVPCRNLASQKVILQQYPQYAPFYDFRHPATPSDEE